jgi:hypothetical protein
VLCAIVAGAAGTQPADATTSTTMSAPPRAWLGSASTTATFPTIVTFDSYSGVSRIDSVGVGASKLSRLPVAFATLSAAQVREVAAWPETRRHESRAVRGRRTSVREGADDVHARGDR